MPNPSKWGGDRVFKGVRIPRELNDWLKATADREANGSGRGVGENDLIIRALLLYREFTGGPTSPVATEVLEDALARMVTPREKDVRRKYRLPERD